MNLTFTDIKKKYIKAGISFRMLTGFAAFILLFAILFKLSKINYLFYHSLIETFGIVISCGVFMFAFNSRMYIKNNYFLFLGIAFVYIAFLDFIHMLTYNGMSVFNINSPNIATELWIAASYTRAFSLLAAPFFLKYNIRLRHVIAVYTSIIILIFLSIFTWRIFPDCYIPGAGLTLFKIWSEYIISLILAVSIFVTFKFRDKFEDSVLTLIIATIIMTALTDIVFSMYKDVSGLLNFSGHILKLLACGLIYWSVIHTGLRKPYYILFRELKTNEEKLLQALSEIKTLKGILPICSSCKKIRDDKGYWEMVEVYISKHSDAKFSHGICNECAEKFYPEIFSTNSGKNNGT